jgi:hypothetical protein
MAWYLIRFMTALFEPTPGPGVLQECKTRRVGDDEQVPCISWGLFLRTLTVWCVILWME